MTTSTTGSENASSTCCDSTARMRASSLPSNSATRRAPYVTSPAVGVAKPVARRSSVDLPAPFGPRITLNAFDRKRVVTPSRMSASPTRYVTSRSSTIEAAGALTLLAQQDPQEHGRADDRRDDADWKLGRHDDEASDDVHDFHDASAKERGGRQQERIVGRTEHTQEVRDDQSDESDDANHRGRRRDHDGVHEQQAP